MKIKYFLLILLMSALLILIWFRHGLIMGGGESGLPFYNLSRMLEISNYSWVYSTLGNSLGIGVAAKPTYLVLSLLQGLKIPTFVLEALFFGFLFVVAGCSIFLLTKELFPKIEDRAAILTVFFYWFNPFSLVNVWNRFLYNYMVFFALLPLATFFFLRGLLKRDYRFAILTVLVSGIFSYALTSTPFNILLGSLFLFITIFYSITQGEWRERIYNFKFFFVAIAFYTLINFWWISQLFNFISSSGFTRALQEFFSLAGNLGTLSALSQRLGNLVDVIRLMHATFFTDTWWAKIFVFPPFVLLEFIVVEIIFWSICRYRNVRSVLFLALLLVISIFLVKGSNSPFGNIFQFAFSKFTPLQVFRNPFEKFGFLLPLAAAPLFAFGMSKFSDGITSTRFKNLLYPGALSFLLLFWGFPFWTGLVFTRSTEEDTSKFISYEVKVPDYYREANDWFKKQIGNFRFISLPLDGEGMTYIWEKPYSGVELSSILFDIPNISFNTSVPFYSEVVDSLERLILTKDNLSSIASLVNVKYLLLRNDIDWKERGIRDPETINNLLASNSSLNKIVEFGKLSIYTLPSDSFISKIWTPQSFIRVYPKASFGDFISAEGRPGQAFYSLPDGQELPNTTNIFIEPSAMVFLPKEKVYGSQDAIASLLYVKYLPDDRFYKFALVKESLERARLSDPTDLFIFDLTHLGKRVVELYRLSEKQADEKYIKDAASFYLNTFDDLVKNYPDKLENSPKNSFWRITSEEFHKQLILLNDIQKKSFGKNSEILRNALQELEKRMINLGFASTYVRPESLDADSWVFRFEVPEDGAYEIRLENSQWKEFYSSLPSRFNLQIDDNVMAFIPIEDKDFIKLGRIKLQKGIHEIAIQDSLKKNLVKESPDINLSSSTNPEISLDVSPFDPYSSYELSFDYWMKKGNSFKVSVYDDNDPSSTAGVLPGNSKEIKSDGYNNDFGNGDFFFSPRSGANSIKINFKVEPFSFCPEKKLFFLPSPCDDKEDKRLYEKKTDVVIRNIFVKKVFNNKMVLQEDKATKETANPSISFSKVNPAEYRIHVDNATGSYVLVFSELYSSGWEARFADGMKVDESKHLVIDAYANGWLVDKAGSYDLTLEFAPQDLLDVGKKVSLVSTLGALALLVGLTVVWRRKLQ